jgi:hypothetical protein
VLDGKQLQGEEAELQQVLILEPTPNMIKTDFLNEVQVEAFHSA